VACPSPTCFSQLSRRSAIFDLELLALRKVQSLCPRPLSNLAVGHMICQGLGAQPDPLFVTACARATGGNPFALRGLIFDPAAELDIDAAAGAADALVADDLLAPGRPRQFGHPLVRSVVYKQLAPGTHAQAHARAAGLLGRGAVGL
jgi:hypothetical protein